MISLSFFLAAQALEMYLKAFLVSREGKLPEELSRGKKGHDLVILVERAATVQKSAEIFRNAALRKSLDG
jgi:HEPN domain-containing protein